MKFLKLSFITLFMFMSNLKHDLIYAQENTPQSKSNYVQIDPFFSKFEFVSSNLDEYSGGQTQVFTARPSISLFFNYKSLAFRPIISVNPYDSSTNGSLGIGKIFNDSFELGLNLELNRNDKSYGHSDFMNETIETKFTMGPYVFMLIDSGQNRIELKLGIYYDFQERSYTANGVKTKITDKKGFKSSVGLAYVTNIKDNIYLVPNVTFDYSYSLDVGAYNVQRHMYDFYLSPISIRILF